MSSGGDGISAAGANNTSALGFGGRAPGYVAATEEWNDPGTITKTLTT